MESRAERWASQSRRYRGQPASSSAWVPAASIRPPFTTAIWSASAMVESRWAMTMRVLPRTSLATLSWMTASFSGSV